MIKEQLVIKEQQSGEGRRKITGRRKSNIQDYELLNLARPDKRSGPDRRNGKDRRIKSAKLYV